MEAGKYPAIVVFLVLFLFCANAAAQAEELHDSDYMDVTAFSSLTPESFLKNWKIKSGSSIPEQTRYRLVVDNDWGKVIEATAQASFAGITRELEIEPQRYPVVVWSWKVSATIESANLRIKEKDDAPARLLISFGRDFTKGGRPKGSLCYVWSAKEPEGSFIVNPYSSDIMVIVVASGRADVGVWQHYRRNIVDDYRRAFGDEPGKTRAVTIITDTDNTREQLTAWYGAIGFTREKADY
jgi:hypothetical protein